MLLFVSCVLIVLLSAKPSLSPAPKPCFRGVCVPPHLCTNNTVLSGGEGILDVRFATDYHDDDAADDDSRFCDANELCCLLPPPDVDDLAQRPPRCGIRRFDPAAEPANSGPRSGPRTSQFAEFPWTVAILRQRPVRQEKQHQQQQHQQSPFAPPPPPNSDTTRTASASPPPSPPPRFDFLCGGSLIHPHVVLSAAHCVATAPDHLLTVRAGEWDTRSAPTSAATSSASSTANAPAERWPHQDRIVQRTVIHPHYSPATVRNDLALLFLATAMPLLPHQPHIACVCLPPPRHRFAAGTRCLVSGWGKTGFGRAGGFRAVMKRVEVPWVERTDCERRLRDTKLGRYFRLDASFVCAGGERGRDACKGDGGSPLVCPAGGGGEGGAGGGGAMAGDGDDDGVVVGDDASLVTGGAAMLRDGDDSGDGDGGDGGDVASRRIVVNPGAASQRPYYQAGIVAWGVGCNDRVPAAYVNVARFRPWIDRQLALRGWDTAYYTAEDTV